MKRKVSISSDGAIRVGIIGSGRYAESFAEAVGKVEGIRLNTVYDPSAFSTEKFHSKDHGESDIFYTGNIVDLWENTDAVYIAVPNELHVPYAKASLSEDKHVLVASPLSMSKKYAFELYSAAMDKELILMESMPCAFNEAYQYAVNIAKSGRIGRIMDVESAFTRLTPTNLREMTDADYGGSMTELGIPAMLPVFDLLGSSFNNVSFHSLYAGNGTDSYTKAYFDYGKAAATVKVGLQVKSSGQLIISGTKGYILLPSPWYHAGYLEIHTGEPSTIERISFSKDNDLLFSVIREFVSRIKELKLMGYGSFSPEKLKSIKAEQVKSIASAGCLENFLKERFLRVSDSNSEIKEVKIWAHRGCSYKYPENTIESFKAAANLKGLTGIEMDVQLTRDGEVVVIHDENVSRTSDGYRDVKDYKLSELRALRIARNTMPTTIPTLEEVLRLLRPHCRRTGLLINIEFKTGKYRYEGIESKVISIVKKMDMEKFVIYSSFLTDSIIKVKEIDKKAHTAILAELLEDGLAVPVVDPDDPVAVHVVDDGDVPVALRVAGLVHADGAKPAVHPGRHVRLDAVVGGLHAVAHGAPVYAEEARHRRPRHLAGQPRRLVVEPGGEAARPVRPRQTLVDLAVLGALDALRPVHQVHRHPVEVRRPPRALALLPVAVPLASAHALRAQALLALERPGVHEYLVDLERLAVPLDGPGRRLPALDVDAVERYHFLEYTKRRGHRGSLLLSCICRTTV